MGPSRYTPPSETAALPGPPSRRAPTPRLTLPKDKIKIPLFEGIHPNTVAAEDDGGCGCVAVGGQREHASWLRLGSLLVVARRRRRRTA